MSFKENYIKMQAPAVRLAKCMFTPTQNEICVFELLFRNENEQKLSQTGAHTLKHFFSGFMQDYLTNYQIIDISLMTCRTGFHMSVISRPQTLDIIEAWINAMQRIIEINDKTHIPDLNEAKTIAQNILNQKKVINSNTELNLN